MELVVDTLSALGQPDRPAGKEAAVAGGQAPWREAAVRRKRSEKTTIVHVRTARRSRSHALLRIGFVFPASKAIRVQGATRRIQGLSDYVA